MNELTLRIENDLKKFNITDAAINELAGKYASLELQGVDDKDGYLALKAARIDVRDRRIEVEKKSKELKEDAIKYQKVINIETYRIVGSLKDIEKSLSDKEEPYTAEQERIKKEKENLRILRVNNLISKLLSLNFSYDVDGFYKCSYHTDTMAAPLLEIITDEEFQKFYDKLEFFYNADKKKKEAEEAERRAEAKRLEDERIINEAIEAAKRKAEQEEAKRLIDELKAKNEEDSRIMAETSQKLIAENERLKKIAFENASLVNFKSQTENSPPLTGQTSEIHKIDDISNKNNENCAISQLPDKDKLVILINFIEELINNSINPDLTKKCLAVLKLIDYGV